MERVQENFLSVIEPRLDEFVDRYYEKLFCRYPELDSLFRSPPAKQKEHFGWSLRLVVANLRNPGALQSLLLTLGGAHAGYGVEPKHFSQVGECLLDSLREMSGCTWSPDLERSWERAYTSIIEYFYVDGERPSDTVLSRKDVDLFKLAEEYLCLARRRRAIGELATGEAVRSAELRDMLEAQLTAAAAGFPDRRCDLRVPVSSSVEFRSGESHGIGCLTTVGERGVFIATDRLVGVGEPVAITVHRAPQESDAAPIRISGAVVWQRAESNAAGPSGIAIRVAKADSGILDLLERGLFVSLGLGAEGVPDGAVETPSRFPAQTSKSDP